jgi:hypothetical protein
MKIRPMGAEWTDGQIGMTKLIVAFSNFGNAPKKKAQPLVAFSFMWLNNFKFVKRQK